MRRVRKVRFSFRQHSHRHYNEKRDIYRCNWVYHPDVIRTMCCGWTDTNSTLCDTSDVDCYLPAITTHTISVWNLFYNVCGTAYTQYTLNWQQLVAKLTTEQKGQKNKKKKRQKREIGRNRKIQRQEKKKTTTTRPQVVHGRPSHWTAGFFFFGFVVMNREASFYSVSAFIVHTSSNEDGAPIDGKEVDRRLCLARNHCSVRLSICTTSLYAGVEFVWRSLRCAVVFAV